MNRKIVSLILLIFISLSMVGCGNENRQPKYKNITGTVLESKSTGTYNRFEKPYAMTLKTDNGDITLNCSKEQGKFVSNGLKVNITYDEHFNVMSIDVVS